MTETHWRKCALRFVLLGLSISAVGGCGQSGPLYLPGDPPGETTQPGTGEAADAGEEDVRDEDGNDEE